MKKILLGLVALVALVVVLFAVAVARLDSEALGARAIAEIQRKTGIELQAGEISLHPLKGLELVAATATAAAPSGAVTADIEHLKIEHRLLPLLWGEVVMDEVLLQRPVIELVSKPAKRRKRDRSKLDRQGRKADEAAQGQPISGLADGPSDESRGLRLSIKSLRIEDGAFTARTDDGEEPDLRLEQLGLRLQGLEFDPEAANSTLAVSGGGRFETGRLVHGDFAANRASGRVSLDQGVATVTDLQVRSDNAGLTVTELEVQLDRDPPRYTFQAKGDLDLNGVVEATEGGSFGPVTLALDAQGRGPELRAMQGQGTMTLESGSLPGFPSMVQVEELLGRALLTGREYESATIDYKLADNQLSIAPFELQGDGGNVGGSGVVDLAGTLDLDVYVRLPRERLDIGVVDEAHLAALEDSEGMIKIPFTLRGTLEDPQVGMEWEGMRELVEGAGRSWAERALESAAEKAREWLREQSEGGDDG